jgi:hypothetical protein
MNRRAISAYKDTDVARFLQSGNFFPRTQAPCGVFFVLKLPTATLPRVASNNSKGNPNGLCCTN